MIWRLVIALVISATVAALSWRGAGPSLVEVYQAKMQMPMFAAFLTLAGFILSLKTNILLRLYKDLFDTELYRKRVEMNAELAGKPKNRFSQLINLGNFLIWTVLSCLVTSLLQVTLGFARAVWATSICVGAATFSLLLVFWSWVAIRGNLCVWFDILRKDGEVSPTAEGEEKGFDSRG